MADITTSGSDQSTGDGRPRGGEVGTLLLVINTALVGVPGAYAASGSLTVTAIAAVDGHMEL